MCRTLLQYSSVGQSAPEKFIIRENGLSFEMSFVEGYSTGLFWIDETVAVDSLPATWSAG